jgi:hypothetical protein
LKSRSMMCARAWNGRRRLVAVRLFCRSCAQAVMFFRDLLPLSTAVRPPHRTENETCCVWKNAAVKQPSVRTLAYKAERFIPAVKKPLRFQPLVCTSRKTACPALLHIPLSIVVMLEALSLMLQVT